jgi:hypothetical protein
MNPLFDDVIARCKSQRVTGVLKVHGTGEEAEIRFLSGIEDSVRCGPSEGVEAWQRIANMPNPEFQGIESLPPMSEASQQAFPKEGALSEASPVDLMRYCEERRLTCALTLRCAGQEVKLHYELGDLKSTEPDTGMTLSLLEAAEGSYRFALPAFQLPDMAAPKAVDPALLEETTTAGPAIDAPMPAEAPWGPGETFAGRVSLSTDALEAALRRTSPPIVSPAVLHTLALIGMGVFVTAALVWLVFKATEVSDPDARSASATVQAASLKR